MDRSALPGRNRLFREAEVTWDEAGIYLRCTVQDDVHISDANEDDLYENDSVQIYF